MHSFVFCFLKQMMNPSMIMLHSSYAVQVAPHGTNHPWDTSNGLQEYHSIQPFFFIHFIWVIPWENIETPSCQPYYTQSYFISQTFRLVMIWLYMLDILYSVYGMSHSVALWVENHFEFGEWVEDTTRIKRRFYHICKLKLKL